MEKQTPFIMVLWNDATENIDETLEASDFDDIAIRSVIQVSCGIVLKDDDTGVVLARDCMLAASQFERTLCIPREYILAKRYLK